MAKKNNVKIKFKIKFKAWNNNFVNCVKIIPKLYPRFNHSFKTNKIF